MEGQRTRKVVFLRESGDTESGVKCLATYNCQFAIKQHARKARLTRISHQRVPLLAVRQAV
ncbi:MAG: hypothetical protein ACWGMZ_05750, partial [Thermoguttaceae bacterium]